MAGAIENAVEQITTAIGDRRSLMTELRPAALDEHQLVQEALTNAAKHAVATRIEVHVSDDREQVPITVRDNGSEFDPEQRSPGFGLIGMRERLALVHGSLAIRSRPGGGTVVEASIPAG